MKPIVIEIEHLSFAYNGQTVLQDVSLEVRAGEFVAMIGPNGGGKTTLLKLMLGLLDPGPGGHPRVRPGPGRGFPPHRLCPAERSRQHGIPDLGAWMSL